MAVRRSGDESSNQLIKFIIHAWKIEVIYKEIKVHNCNKLNLYN